MSDAVRAVRQRSGEERSGDVNTWGVIFYDREVRDFPLTCALLAFILPTPNAVDRTPLGQVKIVLMTNVLTRFIVVRK